MTLPKGMKRTRVTDPWGELEKTKNRLFFGDESAVGRTSTIYRGVVIVGCVLRDDGLGNASAVAGGVWVYDERDPAYAKVLAAKLREAADLLEKDAGS